jgi:hypothetical protein
MAEKIRISSIEGGGNWWLALTGAAQAHWASEDIFYSTRHAATTYCPLHPGAARYYHRELGVLKS